MRNVDGNTKMLGLIGYGIGHTLSPEIHNFSIQQMGQNAIYLPFDIPGLRLPELLSLYWDMGVIGLNVTTPHKEWAAKNVGGSHLASVNTIYRGKEGWLAESTDTEGLCNAVDRLGVKFKAFRNVVILGNGGAAVAIINFIARHFTVAPHVYMLRRSEVKDPSIRSLVPDSLPLDFLRFSVGELSKILVGKSGETILIQATNGPLRGDNLAALCPALDGFKGVVVDLVYGTPSLLLSKAAEIGLLHQDGLPMLIEQARLSQKRWFGNAAAYQDIAAHLKERGIRSTSSMDLQSTEMPVH